MMRALAAAMGLWAMGAGAVLADDPPGLESFADAAELNAWLADHAVQTPPPCDDPDPDMCPGSDGDEVETVTVTGSRIPSVASAISVAAVTDQASITNNQEVGVDEGDIVKLSGDVLVILRRGRLFTVSLASDGMRPVDSIAAYPDDFPVDPGSWYDEMLVSGSWVVVIGYLYDGEVTGTQINRFRLTPEGDLSFVDSHHIATDDYYSSVNYASRLLGDDLILYTPDSVRSGSDPLAHLPTLTRWTGKDGPVVERPLIQARDVRRAPDSLGRVSTIHAVTRCELTAPELTCSATAVLGPEARTFYASAGAGYLWLTGYRHGADRTALPTSILYRIPFGGGRTQAIQTRGAPIDQFSFQEDAGRLHAFVLSEGYGDAMWAPDFAEGQAALLTLDLSRFGDGSGQTRRDDYRMLPPIPDDHSRGPYNRFIGPWLVYASSSWVNVGATEEDEDREDRRAVALVQAVPLDGSAIVTLMMGGAVSRIEPMGADALLVSDSRDGMTFTTLNLNGRYGVEFTDHHFIEEASEAERRSHAFFYRPDPERPDGETGVLGLPVFSPARGRHAYLFNDEAEIVFLRRIGDELRPLGELYSWADVEDDHCRASCVDWYGDSRPIFIGDRIFGLLGYDLVEGAISNGRLRRTTSAYFGPRRAGAKD